MKLSYKERPPRGIKYKGYKRFSNGYFKNSLDKDLVDDNQLNCSSVEEIILNIFSSLAPFSKTMVRTNWRVFMNKKIYKTAVVRSRLTNKFLKGKKLQSA